MHALAMLYRLIDCTCMESYKEQLLIQFAD